MKKEKIVAFKVSMDEYKEIKSMAKAEVRNISDFIRYVISLFKNSKKHKEVK